MHKGRERGRKRRKGRKSQVKFWKRSIVECIIGKDEGRGGKEGRVQ